MVRSESGRLKRVGLDAGALRPLLDRPSGRFTDSSDGIYCAGDRENVALAETIHHHAKFMAATDEAPGWTSDFRAMIGSIDRELHDVNTVPDVLHPTDYSPSQVEGTGLRAAGGDGLLWNCVRMPGGQCIGVFWPDVVTIPVQGSYLCCHWNGECVDFVKRHDTGEVLEVA